MQNFNVSRETNLFHNVAKTLKNKTKKNIIILERAIILRQNATRKIKRRKKAKYKGMSEKQKGAHKMARPKDYETKVQPHINKIRDWVAAGATNDEIAKALGVHVSTLIKYKKQYSELNDAFARGHANVIIDIKAALLKKALGFHYEEKVQAIKPDKDGNEQIYTEIRTRYSVPSETAAAMLLRNLDPNYHDGDNATVKLKEQEATLRRKIAESRDIIE